MTWLVTGGAGYIGSHVVAAMRRSDVDVVVYDDLSSGVAERICDTPLIVGNVLDEDRLMSVMREHEVSGVVHLAAKKQVEQSVHHPLLCLGRSSTRAAGLPRAPRRGGHGQLRLGVLAGDAAPCNGRALIACDQRRRKPGNTRPRRRYRGQEQRAQSLPRR